MGADYLHYHPTILLKLYYHRDEFVIIILGWTRISFFILKYFYEHQHLPSEKLLK